MASIKIEYEGTAAGLVAFIEEHFKDPNNVVVRVDCVAKLVSNDPLSKLANSLHEFLGRGNPNPADLERIRAGLPEIIMAVRSGSKINAIKAIRACGTCAFGLKESKDAIENIVVPWCQPYRSMVELANRLYTAFPDSDWNLIYSVCPRLVDLVRNDHSYDAAEVLATTLPGYSSVAADAIARIVKPFIAGN